MSELRLKKQNAAGLQMVPDLVEEKEKPKRRFGWLTISYPLDSRPGTGIQIPPRSFFVHLFVHFIAASLFTFACRADPDSCRACCYAAHRISIT